MLRVSDEGLELIEQSEAFEPKMYPCPAGHCTIGYGTLIHKGPVCTGSKLTDKDMAPFGLTLAKALELEAPYVNGVTKEEATQMLREEVEDQETVLRHMVKVPLDQSEFDALIDFVYNLGSGSLASSTLLKKLNAGDYDGAANEFQKWVYANHKKLSGLAVRRANEKKLFDRDLPRESVN